MAMDGNMNLVHRRKAGHSTREPIHQNQFFLPQDEVDQYLKANDHRTKTHEKVFISGLSIYMDRKRKVLGSKGAFFRRQVYKFSLTNN